jgi:ribosomal protein S14
MPDSPSRPAGPRAQSPHHADVFSALPSRLMRELDTPAVAALLGGLVDAGWRPGQLRSLVGAEPSQGSVAADAVHLQRLLESLLQHECPDARHARERAEQQAERDRQRREAPRPADPEVRDRWISEIRASLKSTPARRRPQPEARVRAECALCSAESAFFVRRDVHLCRRCVDLLAAGDVRLTAAG